MINYSRGCSVQIHKRKRSELIPYIKKITKIFVITINPLLLHDTIPSYSIAGQGPARADPLPQAEGGSAGLGSLPEIHKNRVHTRLLHKITRTCKKSRLRPGSK
jgi:hypothetical protein